MPTPLSIRTGGRTSSTLRPQWVWKPACSASRAISSTAAAAAASSGAPRQWKAVMAPLSSSRTRRRARAALSVSRAKACTRRRQARSSGSTCGSTPPVIGTAAGFFSGLFGVGGGTVLVPLLLLWLGYNEREATGTSLLAITGIAAVAAIAQAGYGRVDVGKGLLIGIPAVGGVVMGPWPPQ